MHVEPIISSRFKRFRVSYSLEGMNDGEAFERFVCHTVLSNHQPDAFGADESLLDSICVGGADDMGIDGAAIQLNGLLISSIDDVEDILGRNRRAQVEFIFVQSKLSRKFDVGEFLKFSSGVKDFLSDTHYQPMNAKLRAILAIKEHLLGRDIMVHWDNNPSVRLYYVAMGRWDPAGHPHLLAASETLKRDVERLNIYDGCTVQFFDANALKVACDNNENRFKTTIEAVETMPLTSVTGVDNSCIALCFASEYLKVLTTEDDSIRKALFNDNVRDFQGKNSVNKEIHQTLSSEPEKFGLLNNGITVVCDEFIQSNRRISLKNPQVVNGCQTSHVLYNAWRQGLEVDRVPLQIKIIATQDSTITNQIVRGTNRQNIVLDETFETTRQFHKDLEQFFESMPHGPPRIYYERRSKQFQYDPRIKQTQRINLRALTQFFIGMFLNEPHRSHRHESRLLRDFQNRIFLEPHSKLPYFVTALSFIRLESVLRVRPDRRDLYPFRAHLLMAFRQIVAGDLPNLNHEKRIDEHCQKLLEVLNDHQLFKSRVEQAAEVFRRCRRSWTDDLGRSADGMKDIPIFTNLLLQVAESGDVEVESLADQDEDPFDYGQVVKVARDRFGEYYGFIGRRSGDIFFHEGDCAALDFRNLEMKYVQFRLIENTGGRYKAVDVRVAEL